MGPLNNPTATANGHLSQNQVKVSSVKGSDDKSLAAELKEARIAVQNEQVGGSYERYAVESVIKAAGVEGVAKGETVQAKAVRDAAQALAVNADLGPESKTFVAKAIAERVNA